MSENGEIRYLNPIEIETKQATIAALKKLVSSISITKTQTSC